MKQIGVVLFVILMHPGWSQTIMVQGKVADVINGRGIKSQIVYKSYPTGGISGSVNDTTFSFSIFGSSKYQVTATAEGYIPRTIIVSPDEAMNNVITRDIALTSTNKTVVLSHLIFEQGRAGINPKSFSELDELAAMMNENKKLVIQLEGHTDTQGDPALNLKLSQQRGDAVKKYLASKGVSKDRIKTKAFGGSMPLSTENTEEARARNRRVEMRVLKD